MSDIQPATFETVPNALFRLRWRFDFADRPSRAGVWNGLGREADSAWAVPKNGLVRAAIESENVRTFETQVMFECDGADYVSAQWEVYALAPSLGFSGAVEARGLVAGLSFLTRDEKVTVLRNGALTRRPLTDEEKQFQIYEHTAGT